MSLKPEECIVIDVGGSGIRVGFANDAFPTSFLHWSGAESDPVRAIAGAVEAVRQREGAQRVRTVAVGCPGIVDEGRITLALYVPLSGINLKSDLEAATDLRVTVSNDVDAQAMGDAEPAAGRSYFAISAGTAVGGAHIESGNLRAGEHGAAGEIGHIPVAFAPTPCACGGSHCLDLHLSGWALEQSLGPAWWKRKGDGQVTSALREAGEALGRATRTLGLLLDLEYVLLLGHVFSYAALWQGFESARIGLGADLPICVSRDTWPHASRGLWRIASLGAEDA